MTASEKLITGMNVREYFHDSVATAICNQQVDATEETVFYIVNLLTLFSRSEALYEQTPDGVMIRPLASFFEEALEAPCPEQRNAALQRLGDIALFVSGVFANSLNGRLVGVDYYIAMGGTAYGCLSDGVRSSQQGKALAGIFDELAAKFVAFVDVLGEVSENTHLGGGDVDLLRAFDLWARTGSKRAAQRLRRHGIEPSGQCLSGRRH